MTQAELNQVIFQNIATISEIITDLKSLSHSFQLVGNPQVANTIDEWANELKLAQEHIQCGYSQYVKKEGGTLSYSIG